LNVLQNYVEVDDNEIASALQTRWV